MKSRTSDSTSIGKENYKTILVAVKKCLFYDLLPDNEGRVRMFREKSRDLRVFMGQSRHFGHMGALFGCGTWIRTKILASKGLCPTIRRSRNILIFLIANSLEL